MWVMLKCEDELISEQPEASFTGKNVFPDGETRRLCPIHLKIGSGINIHIQPEHTVDMTPVSMATSWRLKTPWKCYLRCVQEHVGKWTQLFYLDSNAETLLLQWDQQQLFSFSTKFISNFKHFHPHDARKLNICIDL